MPSLLSTLSWHVGYWPKTSPSWNPSTLYVVTSNAKASRNFYHYVALPTRTRSKFLTFVANSFLPSNGICPTKGRTTLGHRVSCYLLTY
jgi:hypothetical protein